MRRTPMWIAILEYEFGETVRYAVVRVRDYPGYPPAPHREGTITYTAPTPHQSHEESETDG